MGMAGSVSLANALVIDGEDWYVPRQPRHGTGDRLHHVGQLQVIRGNVTDYYVDRYDVQRVTRASLLCDGRYVLVCDRVVADSAHDVCWQAYLRRVAQIVDDRVVIRTPEQVRCDVIGDSVANGELMSLAKDPPYPDGGSERLRVPGGSAADLRMDIALVPQECLALCLDLTENWTRTIGDHVDGVSLADAYLSDSGMLPAAPRVFEREFDLADVPTETCYLKLQIAVPDLELSLNNRVLPPVLHCDSGNHWRTAGMLPVLFDVTEALREGKNNLQITAVWFHGETVHGPLALYEQTPAEPVTVERTGPDSFRVSVGDRTDNVLVERETGLGSWATGETDARYAFLNAAGSVSVCEVTQLSLANGLELSAGAPVNVAWCARTTELAAVPDGVVTVLRWPGADAGETTGLLVRYGACVQVTYRGTDPHRLRLVDLGPRTVTVNGKLTAPVRAEDGRAVAEVDLLLPPPPVDRGVPETAAAVYALAESNGAESGTTLSDVLNTGSWRVQVAAADVVGQLGIREAVPVLLELFAQGEQETPYPELTHWWRWSKMFRNPQAQEGQNPDLPMPLAEKRWRVKCAAVVALGRLGDARAVPPLEQALARCDDFFPVTSQLALALGRLGSPSSIPILERHALHGEFNTRVNTRLSLQLLHGTIDRAEFERRA